MTRQILSVGFRLSLVMAIVTVTSGCIISTAVEYFMLQHINI